MPKPDNILKDMSMLINFKSYEHRALRLNAQKYDIKAQIIISQKLNCAICYKPLL